MAVFPAGRVLSICSDAAPRSHNANVSEDCSVYGRVCCTRRSHAVSQSAGIAISDYHYQRVSIASYGSAGIARGGMYVCLSVCHTPVLYQNEDLCIIRELEHSSF